MSNLADGTMEDDRLLRRLRIAGWGAAALLLLAPLVAMQFTREVRWTPGDFLFAGLLIGATGMAAEIAVRVSRSWTYRIAAALGLGAGFLLVWANLAVGYIESEDNPYNQLFFLVVAVGFLGSLISRFRARGMAAAMVAAGALHALIGAVGYPMDTRTGPITIIFVGLWLGSAALFRMAARENGG